MLSHDNNFIDMHIKEKNFVGDKVWLSSIYIVNNRVMHRKYELKNDIKNFEIPAVVVGGRIQNFRF